MLLAAVPLAAVGCVPPLGAGWATPIPVQPWVAERMEDKFAAQERSPHGGDAADPPRVSAADVRGPADGA